MARTDNLKNYLTDVADAIREKTNTTDKIKASEFDNKIKEISGASEQWEWALNNVINFSSANPTFFRGNTYLKVMPNYFNEECAKITNWSNAFNGCSNLVDVDIDTSAGTNFTSTFRACTKLTDESIKNLNFNKMTNGFAMFGYGTKITKLPSFNYETITNMGEMFWASALSDLGEEDLSFPNVTNADYIFGQTQITKVPNLFLSNATSAKGLFQNCTLLTTVGDLNLNVCTNIDSVFYSCTNLKNIGILSISKVKTFKNPFYNCKTLESIEQLNVSSATTLASLLAQSNNLKSIDFVNSTSKVTNFSELFNGKTVLETVKGLDLNSATNVSNMFLGCSNLKNVTFVENSIKISFNLGDSSLLTNESIQSLINGLATVTTQQTLTLHADVKAKLTDEQNNTITSKNWKVA